MALKFLYIFTERSQLLQSKIRITLTCPIISSHYHTYFFPIKTFFCSVILFYFFFYAAFLLSLSQFLPALIVFPAFIRTLFLNAEQIVVLWVNVQLNPQLYSIMQMITTIFERRKETLFTESVNNSIAYQIIQMRQKLWLTKMSICWYYNHLLVQCEAKCICIQWLGWAVHCTQFVAWFSQFTRGLFNWVFNYM